jgi:hypothetical protein
MDGPASFHWIRRRSMVSAGNKVLSRERQPKFMTSADFELFAIVVTLLLAAILIAIVLVWGSILKAIARASYSLHRDIFTQNHENRMESIRRRA